MARRLVALGCVIVTAGIAGCGGRSDGRTGTASPTPVSAQIRQALLGALHHSPAGRLPYVAVGTCVGPVAGGPGSYRCHTTPSAHHGLREVRVAVRSDGTWSTPPMPVAGTIDGHHATAMSGLWGAGLRLP